MAPGAGTIVLTVVAIGLLATTAALLVRTYGVVTLLGQVREVLRLDRTALAVGALLLAGSAAVVARLATVDTTPGRPLVVGVLLLVAVPALTVAVANQGWYRAARSLPATSPGDVEAGPVQLVGRIAPTDDLLESPVTSTESVAYRSTTLEEHAAFGGGNDTTVWSPAATAAAATDFAIVPAGRGVDEAATDDGEGSTDGGEAATEERAATDGEGLATDGATAHADRDVDSANAETGGRATEPAGRTDEPTGRAVVDGQSAEFPILEPALKGLGATPGGRAVAGYAREIEVEPGFTAPVGQSLGRGTRSRPRRYVERRLEPGDEVYVLGTAEAWADGEYRIVDADGGPPLVVARCSAEVAIRHARLLALVSGLLGLVAGALGLWLALPGLL